MGGVKFTDDGDVILRARSYFAGQERHRIADALLKSEIEHAEHVRGWALEAFNEQRRLGDRCTYLYGLAASLGATPEQLAGTA